MSTSLTTTRFAAFTIVVAASLGGALAVAGPSDPAAITAQVLEIRDRSVLVFGVGSEVGVKERQVFEVFEETKSWTLPFTGGSKLRVARSVVARAVVFSVKPKLTLARLFEEKGKVDVQQYAVLNPTATAPDLPPHVTAVRTTPEKASAGWRGRVDVAVDAAVDAGKRVTCEWRAEAGAFVHGVEVAPGVYRTVGFENAWVAPWGKKKYECAVKVIDASGKSDVHSFVLESEGGGDARVSAPRVQRTLYRKPNWNGIRDLAFDRRNQCFILDGSPGITEDELLYLVGPDGDDLGVGKVTGHNYAALAVNEAAIFFLDLEDRSVKRYLRNGGPAQILASDFLKIGEKGEGNGRFKEPIDLAVTNDGFLYVLDAGQSCVHCFGPGGDFVNSFGRPGEGEKQLKTPIAIALTDDGRVYVLDNGRKRVLVYNDSRLEREFEVGSRSDELVGLTVDNFAGTICVLEKTQGLRRFHATGTPIATATTNDETELAYLKKPSRVRIDSCRLLHVIDRENKAIVRFDAGDQGEFVSRMGGEKISTDTRLSAAGNGDVILLDRDQCAVYRVDQNGWILSKSGGEGDGPGKLKKPVGVGVDAEGHVFTVDMKKREITKFHPKTGQKVLVFPGEAKFDELRDLQFNVHRERLIVLQDRGEDERPIAIVNPQNGEIDIQLPVAGTNPFEKVVLATFLGRFSGEGPKMGDGVYWVVDKGGERVHFWPTSAKGPIAISKEFDKVTGLCGTSAGVVYVCDRGTKTIDIYSASGEKLNAIKDDQLGEPQDVAADDLGRIYVFDRSKDGRVLLLSE